jgi:hypothetical protein
MRISGRLMEHRCRDDFWLWAALYVAAASDDCRRSSCCCDERRHDSRDFDREYYRSDRPATPERNHRKPLLVIAAVGVVVLLVVIALNSHGSPAQPVQPALVSLVLPPAETGSGIPIEPVSVPAVETSPLEEPLPTTEVEPAPIQAENLVVPVAVVPSLESDDLDLLFFDVGSSRADVIAAQGRPPTYAAHHDRTLWWGSSRVEFDRDGHVSSWVNGTPALNVYRR